MRIRRPGEPAQGGRDVGAGRAGLASALAVTALATAAVGYQPPPLHFVESVCTVAPGAALATSGYTPQPVDALPYARTARTVLALDDPRHTVDGSGVRVQPWEGQPDGVYHPVGLAMYALDQLESYRVSGERAHLDRAVANAEALVAGASVGASGALWFDYRFEHRLHRDDDLAMTPPWFSGMAQGQGLSLLVRLHEETGDARWAESAHATLASFTDDHALGEPHFRLTDNGCLWFEEYVDDDIPPTHVVNGHIYAVFGLYDYAMAFADPAAVELFDAGASTIRESFDSFRVPGRSSLYCAAAYCAHTRWMPPNYHRGVVTQLEHLSEMTGDPEFARMAELLRADSDE